MQDEKHKGNKKILHEIIKQNEIINNSVTADRNNKSKKIQTESSANIEKENQELTNQKLTKHLTKSYIMKISIIKKK